ncbi:MAG: hypothetical protein HQ521_02280 [Bacteroidetes bacterium]|nr:hypothetical protein [Bacteroidota bacterium]
MNNKNGIASLTSSQQYELISNEGKYIGVRSYYNYTINLYLLEDTFYELWYFRPTNVIERIDILEDEKTLNLYIDFERKLNNNKI